MIVMPIGKFSRAEGRSASRYHVAVSCMRLPAELAKDLASA